MFIEMTMEEWEATYKPIPNHLDNNASFQNADGVGIMFETYGEELAFVQAANPDCVWTEGQGDDGGCYIWNGYHFIDRLGYFITEVPCPPDTIIQIQTSIPWYYCENCDKEWEDQDKAIDETYSELGKCPSCATAEELKELQEAN